MVQYRRAQSLLVSCCLLLIVINSQTLTAVATLEAVHETQSMFKLTSSDQLHYVDYVQTTLELILNYLWDSETSLFSNQVERNGTATALAEYITLEQATCINALAYAYPRVGNQMLRALMLEQVTSTVESLIEKFWDEDGAVLAKYPQANDPNAINKYALYQGITSSALIAAYDLSHTDNYLSKAKMATEFMLQQLWDDTNGGFYFGDLNGTLDHYKDTQSQALAISGLISAFDQFGTELYLERARQTAEFVLTYLWDSNNAGFYTYSTANGDVPDEARMKDTTTQAVIIRALSELYHKVNDNLYLDYINKTISFMLTYIWDPAVGGFFAHTSEDGLIVDDSMSKSANKQLYMILALLEVYKVYRDLAQNSGNPKALEYSNYLFSVILEILEFVLSHFWDVDYGGLFIAEDMMGEIQNMNKFAISQALGVEALQKILEVNLPAVSRLQWDPIAPTPSDQINLSVSTFELRSIETIVLKYYLNDNETFHSIPMEPNNQVTEGYEAQIGPFPNGTQVTVFVWANNSMGDEFTGKSDSFLVTEDQMGPAVHLVEVNPSSPQGAEPVTITVHTVDDRPHVSVERVTISYRVDESEWETLELVPIDGEHFNITIDPFPGDSTVEFYFTGYDAFGNPGETEIMRIEVGPEQRTISGFDWVGTLFALAIWFSIRYYISSHRNIRE